MDIATFLGNFKGGTRMNRFLVETEGTNLGPNVGGGGIGGTTNTILNNISTSTTTGKQGWPIHIRATKFPSLTMGTIPMNYRGKTIQIPGERILENWEIIVIDDSDRVPATGGGGAAFNHLHKAFLDWSHIIIPVDGQFGVSGLPKANNMAVNSSGSGSTVTSNNTWIVTQLEATPINQAVGTDTPPASTTGLRSFKMFNCWPKEVGPLVLDMATDNALNYFKVVMVYTHIEPLGTDW